jgi:formate dehydrogenase subunit delta
VAEPPEVRLVNDIARQQAHLPPEEAAAAVLRHLQTFWDPRMRATLVALLAEPDAAHLLPAAAAAAQRLPRPPA